MAQAQTTSSSRAVTQGSTILVIEDDPDTREVYADMLGALGFNVAAADDGDAAIQLLDEGLRPAAIVLDVMMPVGDGFGFRAHQRERPEIAGVPVVIASAVALSASDLDRLSPDVLLRKPFGFHDLELAISSLLFAVRPS